MESTAYAKDIDSQVSQDVTHSAQSRNHLLDYIFFKSIV